VQYADRVVLVPGDGRPVTSGTPAEVLRDAPVAPPVVVDTATGKVNGDGGPRIITAGTNFELPARSLLLLRR